MSRTDPRKQFALVRPCEDCPFKAGSSFPLSPGRRTQIINDLVSQTAATFHCHKTVYAGKGQDDVNERRHCPGALGVAEKMGSQTLAHQLAERLQLISTDHYAGLGECVMEPEDLD